MDKTHVSVGGLCITRKIGQSIVILTSDGEIEIDIARIYGKQVRVLFRCNRKIQIYRKEARLEFERRTREAEE